MDKPTEELMSYGHCPEVACGFHREEHCYYWQKGKCTVMSDYLALTEPIWDKEFGDG